MGENQDGFDNRYTMEICELLASFEAWDLWTYCNWNSHIKQVG